MVQFLIENGSDLNETTLNGSTPLHKAATNGCPNIIEFLLVNSADIEAKTKNKSNASFCSRTPLHEAAVEGNLEAVRKLINWGADFKSITDKNETALDLAKIYDHKHKEVVNFLMPLANN